MAKTKKKHLTRNAPSKCVMARLTRKGVNYQENFTLAQYKTWAKAEAAGERWVKKMIKELPPVESGKGRMSKRNESGIVGVYAQLNVDRRTKNHYHDARWSARWPGCPNKGGVSFSASKYGENEAFAMAYLARTNETVDRDWIANKLKSFKKTKAYSAILKKKQIQFV